MYSNYDLIVSAIDQKRSSAPEILESHSNHIASEHKSSVNLYRRKKFSNLSMFEETN